MMILPYYKASKRI